MMTYERSATKFFQVRHDLPEELKRRGSSGKGKR